MKRIFIPTETGTDWQRLLAKPDLHWKKGKSAMTAAAAWEGAGDALPKEIVATLDSSNDELLRGLELLAAIPEWEVNLEGGETASHTDILALASNDKGLCVIAVEAKVNEDFGPLLKDKRAEPSAGQAKRLSFLHGKLGVRHFDDLIRYQLLHRAASALITAQKFHAHAAVLLVHSFGDKPHLRADFDAFCSALGTKQLSSEVYVAPKFSGPRLYMAWCSGDHKYLEVELPSVTKK
jgi:hypothetical protein